MAQSKSAKTSGKPNRLQIDINFLCIDILHRRPTNGEKVTPFRDISMPDLRAEGVCLFARNRFHPRREQRTRLVVSPEPGGCEIRYRKYANRVGSGGLFGATGITLQTLRGQRAFALWLAGSRGTSRGQRCRFARGVLAGRFNRTDRLFE